MNFEKEICSRCKGDHPNLECMYKNVKKINILKCCRCGGNHVDFYCMYYRSTKTEGYFDKTQDS